MELSTPVVKLWDGVLALPVIGTLDSARTQVVMESLLQAIVATNSRVAIIDITGVPTVDTLVAQADACNAVVPRHEVILEELQSILRVRRLRHEQQAHGDEQRRDRVSADDSGLAPPFRPRDLRRPHCFHPHQRQQRAWIAGIRDRR